MFTTVVSSGVACYDIAMILISYDITMMLQVNHSYHCLSYLQETTAGFNTQLTMLPKTAAAAPAAAPATEARPW
jgi:hypothetical protein